MTDRTQITDARALPPESATVTDVSSEILAPNKNRTGIWIKNNGNRTIFLAFGHPAEVGKGVQIVMNEMMEVGATLLPLTAVNAITGMGSSDLVIQEWE